MVLRTKQVKIIIFSALFLACAVGNGSCLSVTGMTLRQLGEIDEVTISSDGPLSHRDFPTTAPDRIVIDLFDATMKLSDTLINGSESRFVREIKAEEWLSEPGPLTRISILLTKRSSYSVRTTASGIVVSVRSKKEKNSLQSNVSSKIQGSKPGLISMNIQAADIVSVLRSIAEYSGRNIVATKDVKGEVTVSLKDVPWREALNAIANAHGYGVVEGDEIITVSSLQDIRAEQLSADEAERKKEDYLPLEIKVVRVKFANANELSKPLARVLSRRGTIEVDERTGSLIVRDIASSIAELEKLVAELDTPTPQVEITARLVDIDVTASRELGVVWSGGRTESAGGWQGKTGVNSPVGSAIGTMNFRTTGGTLGLDAILQALESENKATIISNPRITTADNREARIIVGKKIPLIVSDIAGNPITQLTTIGIQLLVRPHIISDGRITMDLHPEVSDLSAQATVQGGVIINTSEADTRVTVLDGETAVIGGLTRTNESVLKRRVPLLARIPLLGRLFGSSSLSKSKRELVIFVTPKIIEPDARQTKKD
ncbi:MAG: secretin N-terminal domain-containing protein [Candidatus Eisenbacteria bacterium]|nr:secretin N-terminal domain-containing protein [Candidatus Eisenbacteria bacterium]